VAGFRPAVPGVADREELSVIYVTDTTVFDESEIKERRVGAVGRGRKNVNGTEAAVELRLDIEQSSLPRDVKQRLIALGRRHVTNNGVFVVAGHPDRSQEANREAALGQILRLLMRASRAPAARRPAGTRPKSGTTTTTRRPPLA
jgi:ribosome-associated protein